ncbi:MAG TPA: hypothetical protein VFI73_08580 [Candidatus Nitrosopolaris sp.]|nr:hypothetical protein [Candidatus Nitrosopolaris sp.]
MKQFVTLAIAGVVAAMIMMAVVFAITQQALAYRHHNNHSNSIKVDQQVNQQNSCTGVPVLQPPSAAPGVSTLSMTDSNGKDLSSVSGTVCLNSGDNSADIHK